jgi:hypothetical protein
MAGGVKIKLKPKATRHSTESGLTLDTSRLEKVAASLPYQQSPNNSIHIQPIPFASELDHFSRTNHKLPLTANSGSTWRRPSNSLGMPSTVKRSVSTPNVRGQAAADAAGLSFADKRRNKLGYHRTSVACGKSKLDHRFPFQSDIAYRSLPKEENKMFTRGRRLARTLFQLHTLKERL